MKLLRRGTEEDTTVTALVINRKIERLSLDQLARQVHASMARAIHPFHTIHDGDVLFALSTDATGQDALDDFTLARSPVTLRGMQ